MKPALGDGENDSAETQWPRVLKLNSDEFRQCYAVAQLALRLCELKKVNTKAPLEKENLDPAKFLDQAWELIESARGHVSRAQTETEYLVAHGGNYEAAEDIFQRKRRESCVPFAKLCNQRETCAVIELHSAEPDAIVKQEWKVYRSEAGFDKLFWRYWNATSKIGDEDKRKEYGAGLLGSWKRDGLPPNPFLALAKFRKEHDKRAANLQTKRKQKHRLAKENRRTH
jgi:hypothetical protein